MGKDKNVSLVTGGCGFIGRHLVKRLIERGDEIWIIDNLSTGTDPKSWLSPDAPVHFMQKDVLDFYRGLIDIPVPKFDDVFHLAAIVKGRGFIEKNSLLVGSNLAMDSMFFYWLSQNKERIGRALYPSSGVVYPEQMTISGEKPMGMREDMVSFDKALGMPDSLTYGWAKLTGEYLAQLAAKKYGIHIACVRPFSGYGEDQDADYPIPAIARRIARREDPIEVWGSGDQGRDFLHADDWVGGALTVLDHVSDGRAVNIGNGRAVSFKEIINTLADIAGYKPTIKPLLDKPVGFESRYADISLIKSFGWHPEVSLRDGLKLTLEEAARNIDGIPT
jgi:nucleoside-diphosphate-sugar epimerase